MKLGALLGLVVLPFVAYPLVAGSFVALDTVTGEQLFLYQAGFERRNLVTTFVADYIASLPLMVGGSIVLAGAAFALHRMLVRRVAGLVVIGLGVVAALIAATLLTGSYISGAHFALVCCAVVFSFALNFFVQRLAAPAAPEVRA